MANAEKELESQLREVGSRLGSPPIAVDELLSLLDQTETFLSRVEQSPSQSMSNALRPAMKALVADELLGHSDTDVKVAVASCISEITRITAPDAPYDDDLMKEVFKRIVESFEKLDDMSSRMHSKRVSILETVAKVRSCVVMLDLECDDLILDMFRHFLKTISSNHSGNVFSSMETIMSLVIEESEDISSELVSCLLDSVKLDNKELQPISLRLGEKVIGNCAVKLKPTLTELAQSSDTPLNEYSKIVTILCHENSDAVEQNDVNASGENMADDSKLSERTVSDELPQGSGKMGQEVGSTEEVGTAANDLPRSAMSNGNVPTGNGEPVVEPASPKQRPEQSRRSGQSKGSISGTEADADNLELVTVKPDNLSDPSGKKIRTHRGNSSSQITDNGTGDVASRVESPPNSTRPKRGRPPKRDVANAADQRNSPGLRTKENSGTQKDILPTKDSISSAVIKDSESKSRRQSNKGAMAKTDEGESSQKQKKSIIKQHKEKDDSDGDASEELSLKEMVSPKTTVKGLGKDKSNSVESGGSKRKRAQGVEQSKDLDGSLVGCKIKVWWPDDKMFYDGVVKSFDPTSKKHKIVYNDGDVEILRLKKERWELVERDAKIDGKKAKDLSTADISSETPPSKKAKTRLGRPPKEPKMGTPSKSDKELSIEHGSDLPKRRGRPKGGSKVPVSPNDDNPRSASKSPEKAVIKEKEETPKTSSKLRKESGMGKSTEDTPNDTGKSRNDHSKTDKGKSGRKSRDDTSKSDSKSNDGITSVSKKANKDADESKSSEDTPSIDQKPKSTTIPKNGDPSKTNGSSEKGKVKVQESRTSGKLDAESAKAQESEASTGKKRRRKGQT
ncbi:sister chromatid cohesion protein PDS5 homolog C-like [Typha latifolia]|uniref:sister chromatid cohesion protein PDS5 homolog C-like n=1 Tax=Typha latifolia TaxID=4733 RepID=UPI003C2BADCF